MTSGTELIGFFILVEIQMVSSICIIRNSGERGVDAWRAIVAPVAIGGENKGRSARAVVGNGVIGVELQINIAAYTQIPVLAQVRKLVIGADGIIETKVVLYIKKILMLF